MEDLSQSTTLPGNGGRKEECGVVKARIRESTGLCLQAPPNGGGHEKVCVRANRWASVSTLLPEKPTRCFM
jgi:hypothetical protein